MQIIVRFVLIGLLFVLLQQNLLAQSTSQKPALNFYTKKQKGFGFVTGDSLFSLNFQFRMQNRALYTSKTDTDLSAESFEFRVRRLRMKFTGFIFNPKLTYYFQLGFARGDMDWRGNDNNSVNNSPNVIRDAVVYYQPNSRVKIGFGQTKLPGNRQRIVSSGELQFFDRSIVNARFTLDRDFGFFYHYTTRYVILRGSLTSGEGRNSDISSDGLAATGRIELLPFGAFTDENDYMEGDLVREKKPKLSIAATFSDNANAQRQLGQLGNDLFDKRSIQALEFDMVAKYNGWAWYSEFMNRTSNNPITFNSAAPTQLSNVFVGYGWMSQISYLFRNSFEVAGRYAQVTPDSKLYNNASYLSLNEKRQENYEMGVTKYLNGHRIKLQGGIMYTTLTDLRSNSYFDGFWSTVLQMEVGI